MRLKELYESGKRKITRAKDILILWKINRDIHRTEQKIQKLHFEIWGSLPWLSFSAQIKMMGEKRSYQEKFLNLMRDHCAQSLKVCR